MGVNFRCFHRLVSLKPRSAGTTVSLESRNSLMAPD